LIVALVFAIAPRADAAKNVILVIADGAGYNTWTATSMYQGTLGRELYDQPGWVRLAASTHALRSDVSIAVSAEHAATQMPALVYDPVRAWDTTPVEGGDDGFPYRFAGYRWLRETAPDSASTMTAMTTGTKTYDSGINIDGAGKPLTRTLARLAKQSGRRVGVVSDVPFSHATPAAAAGVSHEARWAYCPLAVKILSSPDLDVVAGCGHPEYDNNGERIDASRHRDYRYVGGERVWNALAGSAELTAGETVCGEVEGQDVVLTAEQIDRIRSWSLVQEETRIESLVQGQTPERLLIVPRVGVASFRKGTSIDPEKPEYVRFGATLQQDRGSRADARITPPGYDPLNAAVPSLEAMTLAALNALDDGSGFLLAVEGGAIDWAMHAEQMGRMIEETMRLKQTLTAIVSWIEDNGGWGETLLVVVADHDHLLWGPESHVKPFDPLRDNGKGRVPAYRWLSDHHSNMLVPLRARGRGAEKFVDRATRRDPFRGAYLDQTDVFGVIASELAAESHE